MPKLEEVDWAKVDKKIPTANTPAGQAARKALFDIWDPNNSGTLTLTEVNGGLPTLVTGLVKNRKFAAAIKCAFKLARDVAPAAGGKNSKAAKEAGDLIDRAEFHALLVAFRHYLELDILFDSIDKDGSRMVCWKEFEPLLPKLESWNLGTKAVIKKKFPDEWTESLKFEDFADWCINRKFHGLALSLDENDAFETLKEDVGGGDAGSLLKAFEKWDGDGSGCISEEELYNVLNQLDETFTKEMGTELFAAADINKDGKIDYAEFSKWIAA